MILLSLNIKIYRDGLEKINTKKPVTSCENLSESQQLTTPVPAAEM